MYVIVSDQLDTIRKEGRVREKNGDSMRKLKRAAAVVAMVGGIGLAGGGVASADGYDGPYPYDVKIENLQVVDCDQSVDVGDDVTPDVVTNSGDAVTNNGNICTVIGSVEG